LIAGDGNSPHLYFPCSLQAGLCERRLIPAPASTSLGADAFPDTYPLQLINIVATDPSAQSVAATETDGSIPVQGDAASALPLQS